MRISLDYFTYLQGAHEHPADGRIEGNSGHNVHGVLPIKSLQHHLSSRGKDKPSDPCSTHCYSCRQGAPPLKVVADRNYRGQVDQAKAKTWKGTTK